MRKPVFRFSNQVHHKLSCAATENGYWPWLEILDLGSNENKAADQLRCYYAAYLHLCFKQMQKAGFLMTLFLSPLNIAEAIIITHQCNLTAVEIDNFQMKNVIFFFFFI